MIKGNLELTKTELATAFAQLNEEKIAFSRISDEFPNAKNEILDIKSELSKSKSDLASVKVELATLSSNYDAAQAEVSKYKNQVSSLAKTAEDNKFYFYYLKPEQKFGVDNLVSFLRGLEWTEPYKENVFDCSEMSASLERTLENAGFHTMIIVGKSPGDPSKGHAWLLVEASAGKYMPVEATQISVVMWDNPYFNGYFNMSSLLRRFKSFSPKRQRI